MTDTIGPPIDSWWFEAPFQRSKEDRPCCNAKRDHLNRLPIGYCGPDCEGIEDQAIFLEYQRWRMWK